MGASGMFDKAKDALNKAKDALSGHGDKVDETVDKAGEAVKDKTPDQVDSVADRNLPPPFTPPPAQPHVGWSSGLFEAMLRFRPSRLQL